MIDSTKAPKKPVYTYDVRTIKQCYGLLIFVGILTLPMLLLVIIGDQHQIVSLSGFIFFCLLLAGLYICLIQSKSTKKYIDQLLARRTYQPDLLDKDGFDSHCWHSSFQLRFEGGRKPDDSPNVEIKPFDDQKLIGSTASRQSIRGETANYRLYDVLADIYYNDHGTYKQSHRAFYTVFEVKLRQKSPHLLFDSKLANKLQFSSIYSSNQKLTAITEINDHFCLYSPRQHNLETLSFITPEVIESLIDLKDADVELIGDSLLCYGPLLNEEQLSVFRKKCLNLYYRLNDNLSFYKSSDKQIDVFAKKLLRSPRAMILLGAISAIFGICFLILFVIIGEFNQEDLSPKLFCLLTGLYGIISAIKILMSATKKHRQNKQQEQDFIKRQIR